MGRLRMAGLISLLALVAASITSAKTTAPSATISFSSAESFATTGSASTVTSGYGVLQPVSGATTAAGLEIFGYRSNNVLVSETSVPASALLQSGRIFAEMGMNEIDSQINTGLALANPNDQAATVTFFFTDLSGLDSSIGTVTIPGKQQIGAFLNQSPFKNSSPLFSLAFTGSFTFSSSLPIAAVALRGRTNGRSDFLLSTLPVADLSATLSSAPVVLPHYAIGAGWFNDIALVNPTDMLITGSVTKIKSSGGLPLPLPSYSIAPHASMYLGFYNLAATSIETGSIVITPSNNTPAPVSTEILSLVSNGVTVTEAAIHSAAAGLTFRVYAESGGSFPAAGSIQSGLAIANPLSSPVSVNIELDNLDGSQTGLTGTVTLPANGQYSAFLNQIPGLTSVQSPFKGILRLTSGSVIAAAGLRGRYNERNDFLITTTPPVNEAVAPSAAPLFFPDVVDSGGYTSQFLLFGSNPGQSVSGVLELFSSLGVPLALGLQ